MRKRTSTVMTGVLLATPVYAPAAAPPSAAASRPPSAAVTTVAAVPRAGEGESVPAGMGTPTPEVSAGPDAEVSAGPDDEFLVTDVLVDPNGTTHTRLIRRYRKLPVLGGDLVVHQGPGGGRMSVSETLTAAPELSVDPRISSAVAGRAARRAVAAAKVRATRFTRPRLVVDARDGTGVLAYRVTAHGRQKDGQTPSRTRVTVDAGTGRVIGTEERIETTTGIGTGTGTGKSLYGGMVALTTTLLSNGTYQLADSSRGGLHTTHMGDRTTGSGTVFTDADNVWGTGTTSSDQSAAVDAHYGTTLTWDYFKNTFGRNGVDGAGRLTYNRVHYGSGYENAFWEDGCFCLAYGDGATYLKPLVSLDVAAHEMSHGVTSTTANLDYRGESGGLNEATSDIFGSLVEFHAGNSSDVGDYLIGETIVKPALGYSALRYMDRPSRDDFSADYWSPDLRELDVHASSGVGNHFFFLLAEGSGARTVNGVPYDSPTINGSTVTGIGRDKAGAIWYRALTVYMTSGTNYAGARVATLTAAADLYGPGGAEHAAVAAAWSAVNVG